MNSGYLDGLMEGHEPPSTIFLSRTLILLFLVFSFVAGILSIAGMAHDGSRASDVILGVGIFLLVVLTLVHIRWYRLDNQYPKYKRATYFLMFVVVLIDVAAFMNFSDTMHYVRPTTPPVPEPCPTDDPLPTDPSTTAKAKP